MNRDPVGWVRSQNYHRRHMTASQKAIAEVELSNWAREGRPRNPAPGAVISDEKTVAQMAKFAEVGTRTIEQAKEVVKAGLAGVVKAGEVSVKKAAEIGEITREARQEALDAPARPESPETRGKAR